MSARRLQSEAKATVLPRLKNSNRRETDVKVRRHFTMHLDRIIHVAQISLTATTGMGRIACEWQAAAQRNGIEFVHVGNDEVGPIAHRVLFPTKARNFAEKLAGPGTLYLIHEPSAWPFRGLPQPKVAFSHGVELRGFEVERKHKGISLKRRFTEPVWRWLGRRSLTSVDALFASNHEDRDYLTQRKILEPGQVRIFRNGTDPVPEPEASVAGAEKTIVFNASWHERKGTLSLVRAAVLLKERGIQPQWLLIGVCRSREEVLADWPEDLWPNVTVIPEFQRGEELSLLARGEIFVLPSYYEGQSLALLQAMAAARCCVTSDCCGQRDIIRNGQNGLLFPTGDAEGLADQLQLALLEKPDLRRELGMAARMTVKDRSWPEVTDELILWLREVAAKKRV